MGEKGLGVGDRWLHSWCMCVVGHRYGGMGRGPDGGSGWRACGPQPGWVCHISGYSRTLPVYEVWTDVESNLCVTELPSAWQYAGTCDGRRRWSAAAPPELNKQTKP